MTQQMLIRVPEALMSKLVRERDRRKLPSIQAALILLASERLGIEPEIPYPFGRPPAPKDKKAKAKTS